MYCDDKSDCPKRWRTRQCGLDQLRGLVDFARLEDLLTRIGDRIDHVRLDRPSPLAAPLFLEPGKVPVHGLGREKLAEAAAAQLMRDAGLI